MKLNRDGFAANITRFNPIVVAYEDQDQVHTWGGIYLDHPGFLKAQQLLLKIKNKIRANKQKSKT